MVCVALALVACAKKEEASKRKPLVGFSQSTMIDPWRIHMLKQMEEAAAEHADEIEFTYLNADNDALKQIDDVRTLRDRGVAVLIISPLEAAQLTPVVREVYQAGLPVITLDRNITTDDYTCFIGADNLAIGEQAGEFLAEVLKGKGKVVEIEGIPGASATIERHEGFRRALASYPEIEVIVDQPADYKRVDAIRVMENALDAHPQIDAVYAHNDEMALGAIIAAKAAGRAEGLIVIGIDGQQEAIESIRRGEMTATFVYPNGSREAIETALRIIGGEEVPKRIELETMRIDSSNADSCTGF